ncbi:MAG: Uma2 family endonuclease [Planctomycetota bacterium]|nr:Uma2 family endonuclease [Planctomycetota bacterium]MDP7254680.1 Uma2 family endonuclease [Planctomycetota bacterium]
MITQATAPSTSDVVYPDSDGEPMADNTLQYEWIHTIKSGLDNVFADDPDVFVAGDLLWYPVEGDNKTRTAPDALVAIGRPKGYRGSYRQWEEAGIAPQVVFEVLSPGNRPAEMARKRDFYEEHGVEEYYIYNPNGPQIEGYIRRDGRLEEIPQMHGWISPRLGIQFELVPGSDLTIREPDGSPFMTHQQVIQARDAETERADRIAAKADRLSAKADRLAAKLKEMGIDPDEV